MRAARRIVAMTGAGISAESGLPTFRDAQTGLWAKFKPEDLATPEAFAKRPQRVWDWYAHRRVMARDAQPNAGHRALVDIERAAESFVLITQNVDGLHQRAGSQTTIELHGNIHHVKCSRDGERFSEWAETGDSVPPCPRCGALLRPDVVWFGERLPPDALDAAAEAAQNCDVYLVIGTSGQVQPAASLARVAQDAGAIVIVVNADPNAVGPSNAIHAVGPAGSILPMLAQAHRMRA